MQVNNLFIHLFLRNVLAVTNFDLPGPNYGLLLRMIYRSAS